MCFLKCTLQEGVPEFPLYNIKGKHGEMDADMDAGAAPWRYASLSRILQEKDPVQEHLVAPQEKVSL